MIQLIPNNSQRKWIFELSDIHHDAKKSIEVFVKPQSWMNTDSFIVVPFSIHSIIYDGIEGDLKIKGFLNTIKSYAKNKILILLCEGAHLNALSMKYNNIDNALTICKNDANKLLKRFANDFNGCDVSFWQDFVWQHKNYDHFKSEVVHLYKTDTYLQSLINTDVEKLHMDYFFPGLDDKELFYKMTQLDLMEMITGIKIMHEENFKVLIYPGSIPNSFRYLINLLGFNMNFINASIKCRNLL
jgi:hypothetical protein